MQYEVVLPLTGTAVVLVDADDEETAIKAALEQVTEDDLESWECVRAICEGNFFHGQQNEAEAILVDESDTEMDTDE